MKTKVLFACDLDNTLLISSRGRRAGDICAERLKDKEQSFISPKTRELLLKLSERPDIIFLPVTSRSEEQYERIMLPFSPEHALICNGTSLLKNGEPDERWEALYSDLIKKYLPEAQMLLERYADCENVTSSRIVDGRYFFAACTDETAARALHERIERETGLTVMLTGRKLYRFPEGFDKGSAVQKFAELYGCSRVIAAGDSLIDIPMLNTADIALVPDKALAASSAAGKTLECPQNERFSEFILEIVLSS